MGLGLDFVFGLILDLGLGFFGLGVEFGFRVEFGFSLWVRFGLGLV